MKTLLALVLFLIVACGVEIGNCADEPTCEGALEEVGAPTNDKVGYPTEEPIEEVPPCDAEEVNA